MKARKPRNLRRNYMLVAMCVDDVTGRHVVFGPGHIGFAGEFCSLSAWLTKAAAWCREGGR